MTPIISPWIFYFAAKVNIIIMFSWFIIIGMGIVGLLAWLDAADCEDSHPGYYEERKKIYKKPCLTAMILSLLVLVITPTQTTLMQMLIAQNITYERLEVVGNSIEDVYNDIINLAEKTMGVSENE